MEKLPHTHKAPLAPGARSKISSARLEQQALQSLCAALSRLGLTRGEGVNIWVALKSKPALLFS
jgi:hypothetical protein